MIKIYRDVKEDVNFMKTIYWCNLGSKTIVIQGVVRSRVSANGRIKELLNR